MLTQHDVYLKYLRHPHYFHVTSDFCPPWTVSSRRSIESRSFPLAIFRLQISRYAEMDEIVGDRKKTGDMLEQLGHDKCVDLFHKYNEMNAQRY